MATSTMTTKGQITIPKEVRDDLHLVPGSKVMFVKLEEGHYRLVARTGKVEDLAGMLHRAGGRSLSIDEVNEGTAEAAAESGLRGMSGED